MHRPRRHLNIHRTLKALKTNFQELLIADSVRAMAISLFSIFVPVFLYQSGYSIVEIIVFQLIYPIVYVAFASLATYNLERIGIKKTLVTSYAVTVLFYISLFQSDIFLSALNKYAYLLFLVVLFALSESVFYCSHGMYFIKSTNAKNSAKKCGLIYSLPVFFSLFAPFVGAVLIEVYGFKAVFLLCAVLMMVAGMIIFATRDYKVKIDNLEFRKVINAKRGQKNYIYFVQGMIYKATDFVWPFMMFIAKIKIIAIGFVYLISNISAALSSFYTGRYLDKTGSNIKIVKSGLVMHSLTVLARGFLREPFSISILHLLAGLFGQAYSVSLDSGYYSYAHRNAANHLLNRELYINLGKFFSVWVLLFLIFVFKPLTAFLLILIIVGLVEFLSGLFIKKDGKIIK